MVSYSRDVSSTWPITGMIQGLKAKDQNLTLAWMPGVPKGPRDSLLLSSSVCVFTVHLRPGLLFFLSASTFYRGSVGGFLWAMAERKSGKSSKNIDTNKYHMLEIQHE